MKNKSPWELGYDQGRIDGANNTHSKLSFSFYFFRGKNYIKEYQKGHQSGLYAVRMERVRQQRQLDRKWHRDVDQGLER